MAINNKPLLPPTVAWPWGGPRSVRERLVDPAQLDRKARARKKGDPKNPPLASFELLEFMSTGHSSEEIRLPPPGLPPSMEVELGGEKGLLLLRSLGDKASGSRALQKGLAQLKAPPDRLERMSALLGYEQGMLSVMGSLQEQVEEIDRHRQEEQKEKGY